MRLIDADVLKQHIDKLPALPDGNFAGNHSALKALINMQPTFEPSTNCSEIPNSSDDTISRQAAIAEVKEAYENDEMFDGYEYRLQELPSAQPEKRTNERTETHACDLISRQAAIKEFDGVKVDEQDCNEYDIGYNDGIDFAVSRLSVLPSAQPEPFVDAEKLKRCRFEYINACKIVARPTPDTSKNDIYDANAVIKALHPIFGDAEF